MIVKKTKDAGDPISDSRGWKVKGKDVGTYTVNSSDASAGGYILLYNNESCRYLAHTDGKGNYILPNCVFAPPDSLWGNDFNGWTLLGWSINTTTGKLVPQSLVMPYGTDGYIVKNGTIKFTYINDLENGGN